MRIIYVDRENIDKKLPHISGTESIKILQNGGLYIRCDNFQTNFMLTHNDMLIHHLETICIPIP